MILVKANNNYSNADVIDSKLSNVFSPPNTVKASAIVFHHYLFLIGRYRNSSGNGRFVR